MPEEGEAEGGDGRMRHFRVKMKWASSVNVTDIEQYQKCIAGPHSDTIIGQGTRHEVVRSRMKYQATSVWASRRPNWGPCRHAMAVGPWLLSQCLCMTCI